MLMRQKWQAEIERAIDKVKLGVVPDKKQTKTDKSFRGQWYRAMMRDRRSHRFSADFKRKVLE